MDITTRKLKEHTIVYIKGEIDLYNAGTLKKTMFNIAEKGAESIILDMKDVPYVDSSGVGLLVVTKKKLENDNKQFALLNVNEDIYKVLKIAAFHKFFKMYSNEDEIKKNN